MPRTRYVMQKYNCTSPKFSHDLYNDCDSRVGLVCLECALQCFVLVIVAVVFHVLVGGDFFLSYMFGQHTLDNALCHV